MAVVGVLVVALGVDRRASADDLLSTLDRDALLLQQRIIEDLPAVPPDAPNTSEVDAGLPARVLFVGDSQSWVLVAGLDDWGRPWRVPCVESRSWLRNRIRHPNRIPGIESDGRAGCAEWRDALPNIVDKLKPNVVVIVAERLISRIACYRERRRGRTSENPITTRAPIGDGGLRRCRRRYRGRRDVVLESVGRSSLHRW